jgi:hypothetical protein
VVEGVDFGLGFDAFVFVGPDHFWDGDYHRYAFDRERSRVFYEHSQFHAGYRMQGGRLMAEGLGRDHMAEITHHEVVVHKATELRHAEESHNFAKRTEAHKELTHAPQRGTEAKRGTGPNRIPEAREHATAAAPERTGGTSGHPVPHTAGNPVNTRAGATNEHAVTTHVPAPHSTAVGNAGNTRPGATNEHGITTHTPEAHSTAPGHATNPRPGTTGPNVKQPTDHSKLPAAKPKPGTTSTNQVPSAPK